MKAQRRHELQQNALATKIVQLPNLGRIWLGRALMALAVIAVIAALIVNRVQRSHQHTLDAAEKLAEARLEVQTLQSAGPTSQSEPEALNAQFMTRMQVAYSAANLKLQDAAELSNDPRWLGQAAVLRGDANLAMATIPVIPGATTQPSLAPNPGREEAFKLATEAYNEVLQKYSDQPVNVIAARLGLATIAEDKKDTKAAQDQYNAVANDGTASEMFRQYARRKLDMLKSPTETPLIVTSPVAPLLEAFSTTATATTTRPATTQAATTQPK